MRSIFRRHILTAAALISMAGPVLSGTAFAQQITYYDFDVPQATTGQMSRSCPTSVASTAPLFCFNDQTGQNANPSFLSDLYPAIIDPVTTDNPALSSTHYTIQMTPPQLTQASSMWFGVPQKISNGFTAYFAFKFTPDPNAFSTSDGVAFVIQNSAGGGFASGCPAMGAGLNIVGGNGGCIGYGGIDNSVAFEFDTYMNFWDPDDNGDSNRDNHIAIMNCGPGLPNSPDHTSSCQVSLNVNGVSVPAIIDPAGVTMADGNVHQVVINYSGPNEANPYLLQIYIDPPFVPGTHTPAPGAVAQLSGVYNIAQNVNLMNSGSANDSAYVGFTSSTGGGDEQHQVMAWTFTPHTPSTQDQPISQPGTPTVFPFGTHVYAVTYPADAPAPPPGIDVVITANPISPQLFSQLISNGPFAGSQCQIYDDTGGNCVVYSSSCIDTASNTFVQCPATNANDPITVKTAFDNTIQPILPGFIQGDPFYSQVLSVTGDGTTATVTCTGDCSVIPNQTVTVGGTSNTGFNATITVLTASPSTPNTFTYASAVSGNATGGYLTSTTQQNIFVSYNPQRIDGSVTGRTQNFGSDFVATSFTTSPTNLAIAAPSAPLGSAATVTVTATSAGGIPTGNVLLSVDNGAPLTAPLSPAGVATFILPGLTAGPHSLSASYALTGAFQGGSISGSLNILSGPIASISASSLDFGTLFLGDIGEKSVTVSNTGTSAMTISDPFLFDVGNGDSKEFIALNLCPKSLGIGKSCSMYVVFIAGPSYNQQTAMLKITDNAPGSPQTVNLTATVVNPQPSFSPNSLNLGTVKVGAHAQSTVTLTNSGATTLTLSGFSVIGGVTGEFTQTNACPASLAPKAKCTITAGFTPSKKGARSAYLNVVDNAQGGSQQVLLYGTGN
jgi:Bacterial lectin/Abnormal spindle-like microcephaly-assoc'd, ASPM-SPD-2-Hydin